MSWRAFVKTKAGGWLARGKACATRAQAVALARTLPGVVGVAAVTPRKRRTQKTARSRNPMFRGKSAARTHPHVFKALYVMQRLISIVDGGGTDAERGRRAAEFVRWLRSERDWAPFVKWTGDVIHGDTFVNPSTREAIEKAARVVETFTGAKARRVAGSVKVPQALARLGRAVAIEYESDKWDGKLRVYRHEFGKRKPSQLLADESGATLMVSGPALRITPRGVEG